MKIYRFIIVLCLGCILGFPGLFADSGGTGGTPDKTLSPLESFSIHKRMKQESLFKGMRWIYTGPEFIGGRISSIAVDPVNPYVIYVAAGSGGVFKTINNGTTWQPVFHDQSTYAVGAIAVAPSSRETVWVGTGEDLMARSSYAGTGIFKSIDGGKTWQNMGLHDSHHINRIVVHPTKPDVVYVAVMGHQYTYNEERGLFKTTDGGKTWTKSLEISEKVGVTDVVLDPSNPDTVLAAAWERDRKAWNNVEGGPGSGIYKSTDAGKTWKKITGGFPNNKYVGRIGLAFSVSNPNVVYALLDNQEPKPKKKEKKEKKKKKEDKKPEGLRIITVKLMGKAEFLKLDDKKLDTFLKRNLVPKEYTAVSIKKMVKSGELTPEKLGQYLLDAYADRKLHETNVKGGEVYRSTDKGTTWKKVSKNYLQSFFSTYGYSFCDIFVSPDDENQIYIQGIRMLASKDGGQTFWHIGGKKNVHVDHHALWINPKNPDHIINGNDGGLNFSYDRGKTWQKIDNLPICEFYTISVDNAEPFNIYGGTQDNGSVCGPSDHIPEHGVPCPWKHVGGGDGFFVAVDPEEPNTIYYEYQFGALQRGNKKTGKQKNIMPRTKIGEPALRCNWMTPFIISRFNRLTLYFGAQKLFKSLDRGDTWRCISPDLTTNPGKDKQGDVTYGSITTISESPFEPGLIYTGTDDGNIHITRNDGVTWEKISAGMPKCWVTRVTASKYDKATVYATFSAYRQDNFTCYVYSSTDFGKHWNFIGNGLPSESVNVIREDPKMENVLYLGTDLGIYLSIDKGKTWHSLGTHLPTTAVHDLVIHPRDNMIVIGTHGRGAFIMDAVPIQEYAKALSEKKRAASPLLFPIRPVTLPEYRGNGEWAQQKHRNAYIYFYLWKPAHVTVTIKDAKKKTIKTLKANGKKGINSILWDVTRDGGTELGIDFGSTGKYAKPGKYTVELTSGKQKQSGEVVVTGR